jgi:hypothetical protein
LYQRRFAVKVEIEIPGIYERNLKSIVRDWHELKTLQLHQITLLVQIGIELLAAIEKQKWEGLRDALELPRGTATAAGVGAKYKPCANVRNLLTESLRDNGYDGLYYPKGTCQCKDAGTLGACDIFRLGCRPGILRDGKIVPKERE